MLMVGDYACGGVGYLGALYFVFSFVVNPKLYFLCMCVSVCLCVYVLLIYSCCIILYKLQMYNIGVCIEDSQFSKVLFHL